MAIGPRLLEGGLEAVCEDKAMGQQRGVRPHATRHQNRPDRNISCQTCACLVVFLCSVCVEISKKETKRENKTIHHLKKNRPGWEDAGFLIFEMSPTRKHTVCTGNLPEN